MSTESNDSCSDPEQEKTVKHAECLVCGKKLDCSVEFNGCTIWRTYGNYGSSEFDPCGRWRSESQAHLTCEAVICDECLVKKSSVIRVVKRVEIEEVECDQSLAEWKEHIKKELTEQLTKGRIKHS